MFRINFISISIIYNLKTISDHNFDIENKYKLFYDYTA